MPLSEHEQRVLEQMERQLASDDPRLASTLASRHPRPMVRYVLAGVGVVVGMLLLVTGAATSQVWVGVLGFLVMFAGVTFAFAHPRAARAVPGQTSGTPAASPRSRRPSFRDRMEERWNRRREAEGR